MGRAVIYIKRRMLGVSMNKREEMELKRRMEGGFA